MLQGRATGNLSPPQARAGEPANRSTRQERGATIGSGERARQSSRLRAPGSRAIPFHRTREAPAMIVWTNGDKHFHQAQSVLRRLALSVSLDH